MAKTRLSSAALANKLIGILPASEVRWLVPLLEPVSLEVGQVLLDRGKIAWVFFPSSGVVTKIVQMENGAQMEAGMIGNEGMVPLCLFLKLDTTPFHAVVQNPGQALRMSAEKFKAHVQPGQMFHSILLRFAAAFMAQVSLSAACNRLHHLSKRYCRWLLMTHDRIGVDQFTLTQESMAGMLGVRRMSITPIARRFQRDGLIRYSRGKMAILDRKGLERAACECYGRMKSIYDTLLQKS